MSSRFRPSDLTVFCAALALGFVGMFTVLALCCAGGLKLLTIIRELFA